MSLYSVLVKPLANNADVIVGHNTWTAFESARGARTAHTFPPSSASGMLRIYKNYRLPYRIGGSGSNATQPVASQQMTFPSYPAVPFSLDDFYQTSAGMVGWWRGRALRLR